MEKICGKCSQEQGMPLDERIKLGKSRVPKTVYTCMICKEEHSLNLELRATEPKIQVNHVAKETPKKKATVDQLVLDF